MCPVWTTIRDRFWRAARRAAGTVSSRKQIVTTCDRPGPACRAGHDGRAPAYKGGLCRGAPPSTRCPEPATRIRTAGSLQGTAGEGLPAQARPAGVTRHGPAGSRAPASGYAGSAGDRGSGRGPRGMRWAHGPASTTGTDGCCRSPGAAAVAEQGVYGADLRHDRHADRRTRTGERQARFKLAPRAGQLVRRHVAQVVITLARLWRGDPLRRVATTVEEMPGLMGLEPQSVGRGEGTEPLSAPVARHGITSRAHTTRVRSAVVLVPHSAPSAATRSSRAAGPFRCAYATRYATARLGLLPRPVRTRPTAGTARGRTRLGSGYASRR